MSVPSELALTLAALPGDHNDRNGWLTANEVRWRLALLGFDCTTQQVAAWLGRMARSDMPWVEMGEPYAYRAYRVTRFGITDVANKLGPSVKTYTPWLQR